MAADAARSVKRVGRDERAHDAVAEEPQQPLGRVQELERAARRRGVDDDDVVGLGVVQLVEALHRHVLLGATEGARERAVQRVVPDRGGLSVARRVPADQRVERRRGVELDGVQAAGPRALDRDGHVARRVDPEGAREASRGVHGDDADASAAAARGPRRSTRRRSSCRPRPRRRRRRRACPRARRGRRSLVPLDRARARRAARRRAGRPRRGRAARCRATAGRARGSGSAAVSRSTSAAADCSRERSKRRADSTASASCAPSPAASLVASGSASAGSGGAVLVDHDLRQRHPGAILDLEGGLDRLVDGELARERDEEHAAPRRVGEELGDLLGLTRRTGPPRAAAASPAGDVSRVMAWPVAGASTTMRSNPPSRSSALSLPSTSTSRMPGIAKETTSSAPERRSRRTTGPERVGAQPLDEGVVGPDPPRDHASRRRGSATATRSSQSSSPSSPSALGQLAAPLELDGEDPQPAARRGEGDDRGRPSTCRPRPCPRRTAPSSAGRTRRGPPAEGTRRCHESREEALFRGLVGQAAPSVPCVLGGVPARVGYWGWGDGDRDGGVAAPRCLQRPEGRAVLPPTAPGTQGGPHGARARREGHLRVVRGALRVPQYALRIKEAHGIWGGTTELERRGPLGAPGQLIAQRAPTRRAASAARTPREAHTAPGRSPSARQITAVR